MTLNIGIGPIRGIYDLTMIGTTAAIFAFLPLAQIHEAHAWVDLFQAAKPATVDRLLDLVFYAGIAVGAPVGAWRLNPGMQDKLS